MKKKKLLIIIIILLLIILSSCWNRRELNELGIVLGMGVDKNENGEYKLTVQVVQPQEVKEPSYYVPVTTYTSTANSIFEALRKMTLESPRKLSVPHLRVLVINEELAREGIAEMLEMMIRDHAYRPDFYTIVSRGNTAEDILSIMTRLERIPANKLYESLATSEGAWAPTIAVKVEQLISELASENKQLVLTGIVLKGDQNIGTTKQNVEQISNLASLFFTNIAVFKDDNLIGWLNEEESKAYNYIQDNVNSTVGSVPCPYGKQGETILEVIRANSKIDGDIENGEPKVVINIDVESNIGEVKCDIDTSQLEVINELEALSTKELSTMVISTIETVKEKYNSDIFGFGEALHRSNPKAWKELKENWEEEGFQQLHVDVNVDFHINHTGTLNKTFNLKFKE